MSVAVMSGWKLAAETPESKHQDDVRARGQALGSATTHFITGYAAAPLLYAHKSKPTLNHAAQAAASKAKGTDTLVGQAIHFGKGLQRRFRSPQRIMSGLRKNYGASALKPALTLTGVALAGGYMKERLQAAYERSHQPKEAETKATDTPRGGAITGGAIGAAVGLMQPSKTVLLGNTVLGAGLGAGLGKLRGTVATKDEPKLAEAGCAEVAAVAGEGGGETMRVSGNVTSPDWVKKERRRSKTAGIKRVMRITALTEGLRAAGKPATAQQIEGTSLLRSMDKFQRRVGKHVDGARGYADKANLHASIRHMEKGAERHPLTKNLQWTDSYPKMIGLLGGAGAAVGAGLGAIGAPKGKKILTALATGTAGGLVGSAIGALGASQERRHRAIPWQAGDSVISRYPAELQPAFRAKVDEQFTKSYGPRPKYASSGIYVYQRDPNEVDEEKHPGKARGPTASFGTRMSPKHSLHRQKKEKAEGWMKENAEFIELGSRPGIAQSLQTIVGLEKDAVIPRADAHRLVKERDRIKLLCKEHARAGKKGEMKHNPNTERDLLELLDSVEMILENPKVQALQVVEG